MYQQTRIAHVKRSYFDTEARQRINETCLHSLPLLVVLFYLSEDTSRLKKG
jgi:hypothetical protein